MNSRTPAGWYADQTTPGMDRYWDGEAWTDQIRPGQGTDSPGQFEERLLRELQTANQLLAGIRDRTGVVAVVIVISLGLALLSVAAQ